MSVKKETHKKNRWHTRAKIKRAVCMPLFLLFLLTACGQEVSKTDKIRELEYTVVGDVDTLPEEFRTQIEKEKQQVMKLSYLEEEYLYIAMGYGTKETGGYSVLVKELYESKNAICFRTELMGPRAEENLCRGKSYPYIVVKLERMELPIRFL